MREGKEGGISLRPKGASSQNWTTIATILASKCHHCERSSSQCFKSMLLCSFKPFFLTFLTQTNFNTATCLIYKQLFSCKKYKNIYKIWMAARLALCFLIQLNLGLSHGYSIVKDSSADLGVNLKIVQNNPTVKAVCTKISKKIFFIFVNIFIFLRENKEASFLILWIFKLKQP